MHKNVNHFNIDFAFTPRGIMKSRFNQRRSPKTGVALINHSAEQIWFRSKIQTETQMKSRRAARLER